MPRLVLLALAVLLASCASPAGDAGEPASPLPSPSSSPAYLYTCGQNVSFDPALLEEPGDLENEDSELGQALRDLMRTVDGASLKRAEAWRVVSQTEQGVDALGEVSDGGFMSAAFERSGKAWVPAGWGDCMPRVDVGNRSPATWELAEEPSPSDTGLVLMVEEIACSGDRKLTHENTQFDVAYTEHAISIVATGDSMLGGECIGRPWQLKVDLHEPVGDRVLLDAAVYPPKRRYP